LTASVGGGWEPLTGSVEFFDVFNGKVRLLATAPIRGGGVSLRVKLRPGRHALHAVYTGDATHYGSTSATVLSRVR
jgi:hypothetical protein